MRARSLTRSDWEMINDALSIYEADHEGEEPMPGERNNAGQSWDVWEIRRRSIEITRDRVHDRIL